MTQQVSKHVILNIYNKDISCVYDVIYDIDKISDV